MNQKTALIAGVCLLAGLGLAWPQDVLLRKELKAGEKDVYTLEMNSSSAIQMSGMGDQTAEVKGKMKVSFNTGAIDKETGKADFEMVTSDMKLEFGGIAAMAEGMLGAMPKETSVKAKIDARNRITDMKLVGANMQMQLLTGASMQSSGTFVEFPEKAVKVGDSWTVVVPKMEIMGMEEAKLTAKLVAEKSDGYQVTMSGPMIMKMNMAELAKKFPEAFAGMPAVNAVTEGVNDLSTDALIEKGTGRVLQMTTTVKSKMTTKMEDMGMTADMTGTTTIKMTLVK